MNKKEYAMRQRHSGFTIVEIIIVIAVMGILSAMTAPAIIQMMQKRDEATEKVALSEIMDALERYSIDNNEIPDDAADWATLIAPYTNYSAEQIRTDTWGNPRAYLTHDETETFLGVNVRTWYATLHSRGPNKTAEAGTGIGHSGSTVNGFRAYEGRTGSRWWSNQSNEVTAFANVAVGGDDLMVKFTNYQNIVDNYHTTLERFRAVAGALGSYSTSKYTEAAVYDNSLPDGHPRKDPNLNIRVYYPRSRSTSGPDNAAYSSYVTSDMSQFNFGSDNRIYSGNSNMTRRNEMIQLMRLLGLPDSYCCNAMERFTSGGTSYERAFYYFSNPRPRSSSGCGTRPSTGGDNLPPRMVLAVDSNTCG